MLLTKKKTRSIARTTKTTMTNCKPLRSCLGQWLLRYMKSYMSERVNIIYCRNMIEIGKSRSVVGKLDIV